MLRAWPRGTTDKISSRSVGVVKYDRIPSAFQGGFYTYIGTQNPMYWGPTPRNGRAQPVFRISTFFRKLPGPYVQIEAYIGHFPARKKLCPKGLCWGSSGAPFPQLLLQIYFFYFRLLKIGLYELYLKGMAVEVIVHKLKNCSLRPNSLWPVHGRQVIILC